MGSTMSDQITIRDIRFRAPCGVFAEERTLLVDFSADVTLTLSLAQAAAGDRLEQTVDYGAVAAKVVAIATDCERLLVERMTEEIAQGILKSFQLVNTVQVAITKPHPPLDHVAGGITISMIRNR
jgi:dihydroneopterin aldolase